MKIQPPNAVDFRSLRRVGAIGEAAFTMVEIAISLAIIGFALVAIIGVLPLGLDVQKDNRQETIINQDAGYFMDAIRNGARGLDDLTNYIISITNSWALYRKSDTNFISADYDGYDRTNSRVTSILGPPVFPLTSGYRIIGLLGTPKYADEGLNFRSNHVVAYMRALSGSAAEKFPQNDSAVQDLAFTYRMTSEVVGLPAYDTNSAYGRNLQANLNDLRLLFRWPLLPNWTAGNGRQAYRSLVAGQLLRTNDNSDPGASLQPLYFFQPTAFVNVGTNAP